MNFRPIAPAKVPTATKIYRNRQLFKVHRSEKKFQFNIKEWPHFVNGPICFGKWLKSLTFVAHFSHLKGFLRPQNEKAVSVAHVASGGSTLKVYIKVSIRFLKMCFWLIFAFFANWLWRLSGWELISKINSQVKKLDKFISGVMIL